MKFFIFTCALLSVVSEGAYTELGTVYGDGGKG